MFRFKGWAPRLNKMTHEELLAEKRKLERWRSFIFEKDEKLRAITQLLQPKLSREDELFAIAPGAVLRVNTLPALS